MTQSLTLHTIRLNMVCRGDTVGIAIDEHRISSRSPEYRRLIRRIRSCVKRCVAETPDNIQRIICMAAPVMPPEVELAAITTSITAEGNWRVELLISPAGDGVPGLSQHLKATCDNVLKEVRKI